MSYAHAPDLTHYLESTFVPSVVPQPDEYHAKDQARQYLEKLADQVSPGAKLLPFGSMANGFALKNSDMDLCCFLAKDAPVRDPSELVELLGRLIEQETNYYVKMLPRARIPIIKLTLPPTPDVPMGMACDIGFENRLALENTRLLLTYAMIDSRLRTLVLFLKVWTKRRKINNPYRGTLSSYGYVLLVIHFLVHVKQPPLLPNLQRLSTPDGPAVEETIFEGHDISFFDDLEALPSLFQTTNHEPSGELLIDFFRYFSKDFNYAHSVISIRSDKGVLPKVQKGWHTDFEFDPELTVRDQHKLCIEDPFQLDYNVARTVTKDGLYTIRGEFMRAFRILTTPTRSPEGIGAVINSLCEEREDYLLIHPADDPAAQHYNHRLYPGTPAHPHPQRSPRRRSAPSPRMGPTAYGQGLHHQQPPHLAQSPVLGREHPFWSAMNGGSHGAPNGDSAGRSTNGEVVEQSGGGGGRSGPLAEPFHPGGSNNLQSHIGRPPHPAAAAATTTTASDYSYGVRPPIQHVSTPPTVAGSPPLAPASIDGASTSSRERRQSWDGTSAGAAAAAAGKATSGAALSGGYDLHRFFQNPQQQPSSSSVSEVGGPTSSTMASTASTGAALNGRGPVSLTAPSSPDMTSQSAYFAGHPSGQYSHAYAGRSQYRYGAAAGGHSGPYPGASHVGPRLATSVPRNPHTAHHAYTNPYASAAVPYPLSGSATASSSGYVTPTGYPLNAASPVHGAAAALAAVAAVMPHAPKPIFPEEDRERVAMANRISFGSFPEMLPLPSYAHYHASGGSAAYLAGAGGWGSEPYGVSGPMRDRSRAQGPGGAGSGSRRSGTGRGSLSSTAENEYSGGEEEEEEDAIDVVDEDGSRHLGAVLEDETASSSAVRRHPFPPQLARDQFSDPESDRPVRLRGRSAPHVRMGPDGRETLLFGAIEVTLPRAEDVEEAELEEEMYDQLQEEETRTGEEEEAAAGRQAGEGQAIVELSREGAAPAAAAAADEEREVAFLGPTPHANGTGLSATSDLISSRASTTTTAAAEEELPAHVVRSIPVLTTQPPTPGKGSPALPNALGLTDAPPSPRRNVTASPSIGSDSPTRSLRSSRPGSPRRSLSNEEAAESLYTANEPASNRGDDDATTLANGLSELSLDSSSPS